MIHRFGRPDGLGFGSRGLTGMISASDTHEAGSWKPWPRAYVEMGWNGLKRDLVIG